MSQFDEDVRGLVQVKVVHGSWKRDAPHRIRVDVLPLLNSASYSMDCNGRANDDRSNAQDILTWNR